MGEPVDLELIVRHHDTERYWVELRGRIPSEDTLVGTRPAIVRFDRERLRELAGDTPAYGAALGEMLFAAPELRSAFASARTAAELHNTALRLRLHITPDASELHGLRWETLRDPSRANSGLLSTSEQIFFSRYLASASWRPVPLRAQAELRVLVAVANPSDISTFQLAPIERAHELAIAQSALAPLAPDVLHERGPVSLDALVAALRTGYDMLYLVAHGRLVDGESYLFLEDAQGKTARVPGSALADCIDDLLHPPRLMILAACQSAGDEILGPALTALGPLLAVAGVPAVLAMQGVVSVPTVEALMPAFFGALQDGQGQIDRALALARWQVRERADFWMPVLFMRLTSGRIWYRPGFNEQAHGPAEGKWDPLFSHIRNAKCTPILGPDLIEVVAGARRDLASRLAEAFHFPLAPHDREGLPQVAQFLAVEKDSDFLLDKIAEYVCETIRRRAGAALPDDLRDLALDTLPSEDLRAVLDQYLLHAWRAEQARNPAEPYRLLAGLRLPVYISADPSELLLEALRAAGARPEEFFCPWNAYTRELPSPFLSEPNYQPSPERPLVFRLFGAYHEPESLVLTEDSHFDYLIGVERNKELIPKLLRERLANTALLFLGFRPEDWAFRVFFRILMSQQGGGRRTRYPHISVQVAPEEGRSIEPEQARRYLETYFADFFSEVTKINIYWGNALDFARELNQRLARLGPPREIERTPPAGR